jgi:hypothetical protein
MLKEHVVTFCVEDISFGMNNFLKCKKIGKVHVDQNFK